MSKINFDYSALNESFIPFLDKTTYNYQKTINLFDSLVFPNDFPYINYLKDSCSGLNDYLTKMNNIRGNITKINSKLDMIINNSSINFSKISIINIK